MEHTACNEDPGPCWATALPSDLLRRVLQLLPLRDLCALACTCTALHSAAQADTLWQRLLLEHYGLPAPLPRAAGSSKQCLRQLATGALMCSGQVPALDVPSILPSLSALVRGSNLRSTEPVRLWAAKPGSRSAQSVPQATAQLAASVELPERFAAVSVAAGSHHLVIVNSRGQVIDTRVRPPPPQPPPPPPANAAAAPGDAAAAAAAPAPAAPPAALAPAPAAAVLQLDNPLDDDDDDDELPGLLDAPEVEAAQGLLGDVPDGLGLGQPPALWGVLKMPQLWAPPDGGTITAVAAGAEHVLAISACGRVWAWGSNASQQLGLGLASGWVPAPREVTAVMDGAWRAAGDHIIAAAAGDVHSALLSAAGTVFTAGCNKQGQCGQGRSLEVCPVFAQPFLLTEDAATSGGSTHCPPVAAIACGSENTAVATVAGRLLVCGQASQGQCGASQAGDCCHGLTDIGPELSWHGLSRPTAAQVEAAGGRLQDALPKVTQIALGGSTGYALTNEGQIFAWGAGSKGQLGTGGCSKVQATPARLSWARSVTQIAASRKGGFAVAVDASQKVYTWGAGKSGQLGHGDTNKKCVGRIVKQVKGFEVLQVACGSDSLVMLACDRPGGKGSSPSPRGSNDAEAEAAAAPATAGAGSSKGPGLQRPVQGRGGGIGRRGNAGLWSDTGDSLGQLLAPWADVEGQGPFFTPTPRAGRHALAFNARSHSVAGLFGNGSSVGSSSGASSSSSGASSRSSSGAGSSSSNGAGSSSSSGAGSSSSSGAGNSSCNGAGSCSSAGGTGSTCRGSLWLATAGSRAARARLASSAAELSAVSCIWSTPHASRLQHMAAADLLAASAAALELDAALPAAAAAASSGASWRGPEQLPVAQPLASCWQVAAASADPAPAASFAPGSSSGGGGGGGHFVRLLDASSAASNAGSAGGQAGSINGINGSSNVRGGGGGRGRRSGRDRADQQGTAAADGAARGRREAPVPAQDKGFRRALKRVLASFAADSKQREMEFPASLSAADRYVIHVAAESYGFGHASCNTGADRVIKVWKPSRTRRMQSGASHDDGSDSGGWSD